MRKNKVSQSSKEFSRFHDDLTHRAPLHDNSCIGKKIAGRRMDENAPHFVKNQLSVVENFLALGTVIFLVRVSIHGLLQSNHFR